MFETVDFAPLDGITKNVYRRVWHRHFGGVDRYFIPFFSPTPHHLLTPRDRRELESEYNAGLPSVPQVMTCRADDFIWAAEQLAQLGYSEVNLNLGCPSGTVTAKGKGAGFLARPDELDRFFEAVFSACVLPVSVKTRLGVADEAEFDRLLEIYNRYPIVCLTVHPRTAKEKYRGAVHAEAFAQALRSSRNPICYNGNLNTVEDVIAFSQRFPEVTRVMLGRGLIADPALARKLRGGAAARKDELQAFMADLYAEYKSYYGQSATAAQRMKEVWFYLIHLFEDGEKLSKQLRRSRGAAEYERIEHLMFETLTLRDRCEGELI